MLNKLKHKSIALLKSKLEKHGSTIVPTPRRSDLLRLIKKLRPYVTDKKLIRLGSDGDGGYLVPDDLDGVEACFSPGVGDVVDFERACLDKGMSVFMADGSVDEIRDGENWNFTKSFVGTSNKEGFITMDAWVNTSLENKESDLLLQMDIEGGEYTTLLNISEDLLERFRIVVVEFHTLDLLRSQAFFNIAEEVFERLLAKHVCVHIHPNNYFKIRSIMGIGIPVIAEFTFYRKDRIGMRHFVTQMPHTLDRDNTSKQSVELPPEWFGSS